MREVMPRQLQRIGFILCRDEGKRCITLKRACQVTDLSVDARRQGGFGEPR